MPGVFGDRNIFEHTLKRLEFLQKFGARGNSVRETLREQGI